MKTSRSALALCIVIGFLAGTAHSATLPPSTGSCSQNSSEPCGRNSACTSSNTCQCSQGYTSPTGKDCERLDTLCHGSEQDCVKCDGILCLRCLSTLYVTSPDGKCVSTCPQNSVQFVLSGESFQGRICNESTGSGLSTIYIIIICCIVAFLIILIVIIVVVLRMRSGARGFWAVNDPAPLDNATDLRQRAAKRQPPVERKESKRESRRLSKEIEVQVNKGYDGEDPDEAQMEEFMKLLGKLKEKASTFLVILNDMRRKLKTLPPNSEGEKQCKKVIKDLTRLLFLLNKKPKSVRMPSDGLQLLTWSEHVLTRFQDNHPERAAQITKETSEKKTDESEELTEEELQERIDQDETHF